MAENLKKFLIDLALDPERMKRYTAHPARELDGAGLSADERAALLAGDSRSLRRALRASPVDHMTTMGGGNGHGGKGGKKGDGEKKSSGKKNSAKKSSGKKAAKKN